MNERARHILQPGETVLWEGKPEKEAPLSRQACMFHLMHALIMAALALLTGLASGSWLAALTVLGMLAVLLLLSLLDTAGRNRRYLRSASYLVTDRRVLVCQPREGDGLLVVQQKMNLADVTRLRIVREGSGLASIYFLPMDRSPWSWHAFLYIADAQGVAEIISNQQGDGGKGGAG